MSWEPPVRPAHRKDQKVYSVAPHLPGLAVAAPRGEDPLTPLVQHGPRVGRRPPRDCSAGRVRAAGVPAPLALLLRSTIQKVVAGAGRGSVPLPPRCSPLAHPRG